LGNRTGRNRRAVSVTDAEFGIGRHPVEGGAESRATAGHLKTGADHGADIAVGATEAFGELAFGEKFHRVSNQNAYFLIAILLIRQRENAKKGEKLCRLSKQDEN